eukprot:s2036_g5.t8
MAPLSLLGLLVPVLSAAQGDYQKYMSQYAGDYEKYMHGGGGNGGSGDYEKYYKKYMSQYGSGASGGYEKFMSQYAGDYASKYMPSAESKSAEAKPVSLAAADESHSKKDSASKSDEAEQGGYQQYMNQAGDYKQYLQSYGGDYSKYMQGQGSQAGGYKQYMQSYGGDYSKYMQGQGSQAGDYKQYMQSYADDYSKYMQGQGSQAGGYKQYMQSYGGDYSKYMQGQGSQGSGYKQYMDHGSHGGDYQQYMKGYTKYMQGSSAQGAQGNPALLLADASSSSAPKKSHSDSEHKGSGSEHKGSEASEKDKAEPEPQEMSERQREQLERQREKQHLQEELSSERASLHAELASEHARLQKELAAEAKQAAARAAEKAAAAKEGKGSGPALFVGEPGPEVKETAELDAEKQRLHDELASERASLRKELAAEQEHLRQELEAEAKQERQEREQEQKEEQAEKEREEKEKKEEPLRESESERERERPFHPSLPSTKPVNHGRAKCPGSLLLARPLLRLVEEEERERESERERTRSQRGASHGTGRAGSRSDSIAAAGATGGLCWKDSKQVAGLAAESFYPQPLQVNMGMIVSIFIMLCGSGLYASRMPRQHLTGVGWALLNTFFAVADRLLQRLMLAPDLAPVDISKCGVTLLNNLGGLVPVLLCAIATEEFREGVRQASCGDLGCGPPWKDVPHVSDLTLPSYSWLLASCVVGVGLSYTGIWCQSLISATSFLVLINASKFAIVCIEALFMNSYQLTWAQVLGALITIFGAVTFGQARESQSLVEKPPPETEPLLVPPARV